jgi:thioesterase domain-containing protein/acyl carrier protein
MLPAAVTPLRVWPLTPNGKIDRAALPAAATPFIEATQTEAPRNQTELHLCKVWENVLGVDRVGIRDDFFVLGGNSLLAVSMFDAVERLFGKRLPMDTLWYEGATVETLARILARDKGDIRWPMLVEMQPKGERQPLFCVHTMGGNLFHYDDLVKALGPQQPVYGLQARGVYGTESPRTSVEEIAADCVAAMKSRQPAGPYHIVGFSSGGVVAFEMARQLTVGGETVAHLVLVDTFMPHAARHLRVARGLRGLFRPQSRHDFQERLYYFVLHGLRLDRLRKPTQVGAAHRWAHWSYNPRKYDGDVHLFVAEENEQAGRSPAPNLTTLVEGRVVAQVIPGNHGDMVHFPHVDALAEALEKILGDNQG